MRPTRRTYAHRGTCTGYTAEWSVRSLRLYAGEESGRPAWWVVEFVAEESTGREARTGAEAEAVRWLEEPRRWEEAWEKQAKKAA